MTPPDAREASADDHTATARHGQRGRRAALAVVTAGFVGAAALLGYAAGQSSSSPASSVEAASVPVSADVGQPSAPAPAQPPAPAAPATDPALPAVLPAAVPTSITIPDIGVRSVVNQVGLNPDGTMEVPQPGPTYDDAAWYRFSPAPGELGPAVVIGHIDSAEDGPSVFFALDELVPGQRVEVGRDDGSTAVFEVDAVESYPKDQFPLTTVYGDTDHAALRLITCGGSFDEARNSYRDNVVVFAHLVT